ncbi:MAG: peptidylprolyl isomerase [Firmicutes bacterium]|nr:peptidylprolyl isomerase [Candidatus Fiminaster equi]
MKKTKLALGLMTAMLTAGTLAGCDNTVKYSADGKIISYKLKDSDSDPTVIKADDLLNDYYKDSSKFQSIFDAINSIVVRNYFNTTETVPLKSGGDIKLGKEQMPQIELDAKKKVESDKKTAQINASNNGTSYSDEFEAILSGKGAKDEEELKDKYIEELKKETFDNNFYKYHIDEIKSGDESVKLNDKQIWHGYLNDMVPYHVSHILVKLEDGSGTNYANGTISEDNAKKLFNVVDALAKGKDSFQTIAHRFSEDTGSAANYGDLGIMDYSTSYVNEFKLGIYAYENFLNAADGVKDAVRSSNILIPGNETDTLGGIAKSFTDVSKEAFGADIPTIDYKVFSDLNDAAEVDKDELNKSVIDDSANFYPRNIIYNKYLNRHSVAYIVNDTESADIANKNTGFKSTKLPDGSTKPVLSVHTAAGWTPVLCVRAGSDYQGIHFIIVNRSMFNTEASVDIKDYYTTYYPEQDDYPKDSSGNPLPTYVNFSSSVTADTKAKAESLLSTMKSYDSDKLNKYIFKKYFDMEGLKFSNDELNSILDMWISRGFEKKEQEKKDAWDKTWNDYVDTLRKQNSEREKLVSDACRLAFVYGNGLKKDRSVITVGEFITTMANAMVAAGEIDPDTGDVFTVDAAKIYIRSIRIGSNTIKPTESADPDEKAKDLIKESDPLSVLFKKEGAICNDGKEHI